MSDEGRARSAIDALIDENISLRDEVDDLSVERDEAARRASEMERARARRNQGRVGEPGRTKGGKVTIGYAEDSLGSPEDGEVEVEELADPGTSLPGAAGDAAASDDELASLIAERDAFLADSQRLAADFANYRKQSDKRVADAAAAQSAALVRNLLPVLDACDSALDQDPDSPIGAIRNALLSELERSGLELLAPEVDDPFEPEKHEAVMHEADNDMAVDEGGPNGPRIAEVFRAGYVWKGRVVRPAMVKVVG